MKKSKRRNIRLFAAIAAAAVLTPAIAVGASQLRQMYLEQTGNYARDIVVTPEAENIVYDTSPKKIEIGFVPEDFIDYSEFTITPDGKKPRDRYGTADFSRHITVSLFRLKKGQVYRNAQIAVTDSRSFDTAAGNQVTLLKHTDGRYDGSISFKGTNYVIEYSLGKMTEEEAKKVIENISLIDSDTDYAIEYTEPKVQPEEHITESDAEKELWDYQKSIDNMHIMQIGETAEYLYGWKLGVDVTVESVTLQENFDGLHTDAIGMETDFSKYLDADGKITAAREFIRRGDGINTIDEAVKSEQVRQYVIVTKLKFTNNSAQEVHDLSLNLLTFSLDGTQMRRPADLLENPADDIRWSDNLLIIEPNHFSLSADCALNKNHIETLNPGESAEVTFANLADEDALGNLWLRLNCIGTSDKNMMKSNVIDISNLKPAK